MRPTVYIETTVVSYYTARPSRDLIVAAHQQITNEWWNDVLPGCAPHVSPVVLAETGRGDPRMAERRLDILSGMPLLELTDEVVGLADEYFATLGLSEGARPDSYHLALATWHGMDCLVTWNCKHLASTRVRRLVSEVNARRGIRTPDICTPEELMEV